MKLHAPEHFYDACAITVLAMITGWKFATIRRKVLAARSRYPLSGKGFECKRMHMCQSTDVVFHNEFRPILRQKGIRIYWRSLKYETRLRHAPAFLRKGTYLVIIPDHALIIHNGEIWDNQGTEIPLPCYWSHHSSIVLYARLP